MFEYIDPENSLAVTFNYEATMALQKQSLCTSPDRMYGYMWFLIRNYFGITQTEMGYSFHSLYKGKYANGLSKSAYSKVENGITSVNFDLILIYSGKYGIEFQQITEFYNYLLHVAYNKDCIYLEPCGYLSFGKHSGFSKPQHASNEYLYTDLKNYKNFFTNNELSELNLYIDIIFSRAKKAILFEIEWKRKNNQYELD